MTTKDHTTTCWAAGIVLGLLVWIMTAWPGDLNWFEGLVLGVVSGVVFAAFLVWLLCRGEPAMDSADWHPVQHRSSFEEDVQLQPRGVQSQAASVFLGDSAPALEQKDADTGTAPVATVDDLKEIKGIGPKLEEMLNDHGITSFAQIATWDDERIDHFAELIGRMGSRIRSDDWVSQARTLAAGGTTEFSKRVEEGEVN
ncbi:hypothetical protein PAF17_01190 [Paracoccus sp. Z330]|uniref:Uncharacterized protein n=1 Tax=Paracoccus onchidii TaxID=3017813 RepID=A0ABT4ZA08_9RHOB|nr:helix-hairpin-helix domain-containing protein [Paracoccus onchidii]MDB6176119.1 hypothetical protein [Paracoccus onchidii]